MGPTFPYKVYLDETYKIPCLKADGREVVVSTLCHDPKLSDLRIDNNKEKAKEFYSLFKRDKVVRESDLGRGRVMAIRSRDLVSELEKFLAWGSRYTWEDQVVRSESEIRSLILMSLRILKTMILPSSLFCYERTKGRPGSSGCSVRYTLITLLGLIAARRIGYDVEFDIDEIYRAALAECDSINIGPGDYGLYLWVDSELNGRNVPALLQKLETSLERRGGYSSCIGLEIAWIVIGTTRATERSGSRTGLNFLKRALESIRTDMYLIVACFTILVRQTRGAGSLISQRKYIIF